MARLASKAISIEDEVKALKTALPECMKRINMCRSKEDLVAAELAEADLNLMLERLFELCPSGH